MNIQKTILASNPAVKNAWYYRLAFIDDKADFYTWLKWEFPDIAKKYYNGN